MKVVDYHRDLSPLPSAQISSTDHHPVVRQHRRCNLLNIHTLCSSGHSFHIGRLVLPTPIHCGPGLVVLRIYTFVLSFFVVPPYGGDYWLFYRVSKSRFVPS